MKQTMSVKSVSSSNSSMKLDNLEQCKILIEYDLSNRRARIQVQNYFMSKNLPKFKKALQVLKWNDIGRLYGHFGFPWLEIKSAAKERGLEDFILPMIHLGLDINNIGPEGDAAIHIAVEWGNLPFLQLLVENNADVNMQNSNGDTALHSLLKLCVTDQRLSPTYMKCFEYLMQRDDIELNIPNDDYVTPVEFALKHQHISNMDVSYNLMADHLRKKMFKKTKNGEDKESLSSPESTVRLLTINKYHLLYFIKKGMDEEFCRGLSDIVKESPKKKDILSFGDGKFTFLQYACKNGLRNSVKLLIYHGADINYAKKDTKRPIELACIHGQPEVLATLLHQERIDLKPDEFNETLLHVLLQAESDVNKRNQCLKVLLSKQLNYRDSTRIHVDAQDTSERTPLHYAAARKNVDAVNMLLEQGARVDIPDLFGQKPIEIMPYEALKNFLDGKISVHQKPLKAFVLNYQNFLNSQKVDHEDDDWIGSIPSKLLLDIIRQPELEKIIVHPTLSTVIFYKWSRIKGFFYMHFAMYVLFSALFTAYVLGSDGDKSVTDFKSTLLSLPPKNITTLSYKEMTQSAVRYLLMLFTAILLVLEAFQIIGVKRHYFLSPNNLLRSAVIILSGMLTSTDCVRDTESSFCPQLSACSILLAWFELFLVFGRLPTFSFYVDMFGAASMVLLQFLVTHIILVVAFALSFHTLFRFKEENPFTDPLKSIFKSIIMLTGEFNAENIPFDAHDGLSHLIFVVFIFVITIVLVNLLIGLASSKAKRIEENTFLYKCIAQVRIIFHYENTYINEHSPTSYLIGKITTTREKENSYTINTGHGGERNIWIIPQAGKKFLFFPKYYSHGMIVTGMKESKTYRTLNHDIVKEAQKIVTKRLISKDNNNND